MVPYLSCFSAALFFFYAIYLMGMFNPLSQILLSQFHLSAAQFGWLSASYFWANAIAVIPAGILLDRCKSRSFLLAVFLLCIISQLSLTFFPSLLSLWFCRLLGGIGNAFAFLGALRLAAHWFPKRHGLAMSSMITLGLLGGVVAQTPLAILIAHSNWQFAMLISSGIAFVAWLFALLFLRDTVPIPSYEILFKISSFWQVLKNFENWRCGFYTGLLNLPVTLLSAAFCNLYLLQRYSLPNSQVSSINAMIFLGIILGAPCCGWLTDYLRYRKLIMLIGALLCLLVALLLIVNIQWSISMLFVLFLLLGFFASSQVISYPVVAGANPSYLISSATSVVSILMNLIGAVAQPLFVEIGKLFSVTGDVNYQAAMYLLPIAFLLSMAILFKPKI